MSRATLDRSNGQTCAHMSKTDLDMSKTALDTSNLVDAPQPWGGARFMWLDMSNVARMCLDTSNVVGCWGDARFI